MEINLQTTGLGGLFVLMDINDVIREKRERGWSDTDILEALLAVGRGAQVQADKILEELQTKRKEDNP